MEEFQRRYESVRDHGLPYLVAGLEGAVRSYADAAPYHRRPAYRHDVENSVYVDQTAVGRGLGTVLLDGLIQACTKAGLRQMVAIIGETANKASIRLHERAGFHHVGTLRSVGFKHGQWLDTVLMQRALGEGDKTLP